MNNRMKNTIQVLKQNIGVITGQPFLDKIQKADSEWGYRIWGSHWLVHRHYNRQRVPSPIAIMDEPQYRPIKQRLGIPAPIRHFDRRPVVRRKRSD